MAEATAKKPEPGFFSAEVGYSQRFYFNLNPPKNRFSVVCGGVEVCAQNYAIHRTDGFQFLCLEYVLQGRGTLTMRGIRHELGAGSVFAYGPGIPIEITSNPKHVMTKYFVCFAGRGAADVMGCTKLRSGGAMHVLPTFSLVNLFEELIESGIHGGPGGQSLCVSLLRALLLKLGAAAAPRSNTKSKAFLTYLRCRQEVEEDYLRLRTLEELAGKCGIDPSYLCRLFRTYARESPYQFLLRLKMHHAANLLQQSGVSAKAAASAVGFADQMHFSRVFHRILKVAPTSLRGIR